MQQSFTNLLLAAAPALLFLFLWSLIGLYRMENGIGRRWASILMLTFGVVGSVALCALFSYVTYLDAAFADSLRNPKPIAQIPTDWGTNMSPSNRLKFSRYFAEAAFQEREQGLKYFDINGRFVEFVPGPDDRAKRGEYLRSIAVMDQQTVAAAAVALLTLLVQLAAFLLGRSSFATWLYGLEGRLEAWRHAGK